MTVVYFELAGNVSGKHVSVKSLQHAHPFVVTAEKACLMQRSGAASLSATYVPKM